MVYTGLSVLTPLIPMVYYGALAPLIYHSPAVVPILLAAHYLPKLAFNSKEFDYSHCNLAVANGETNILTSWNNIQETATTYYKLEGKDKPRESIIKLLSYIDPRTTIHDPYLLSKCIVKNVIFNEECNRASELLGDMYVVTQEEL